ncbi:class I SAM-dependent methyltransferase [Williamsia sp.]|uniref:class I SAM-dependent methyltransferase n=1 Tax=Williamsia sp. TaxID=1872085 RepID=UPI002F91D448
MSQQHHHSAHEHHHHADDSHGPDEGLSQILDLDAEILEASLSAVHADIAALIDGPVRRILDLGAGTGTGTFGLLHHFADAHAVAVDGSSDMLEHLRRQAEGLGLADRTTTVHADLDEGVPELDLVDLAWASGSLHHLADPDRTLAQVAAAIRPGGLLAVVELTGHPRFLADDAPGAAAEAKAHELLAVDRTVDMPAMGSDWGARLARAGLVVELDRPIVVDLAPPLPDVAGAYAFAILTRIRGAVVERLGADLDDLDDLDRLLDGGPSDVRHRSDLHVRTQRQLLIARRPASR